MKKILALATLAMALATLASGAPGLASGTSSIQGSVTDSKYHQPLTNVVVRAFSVHSRTPIAEIWTAKDGTFRIRGLTAGEYRLLVSKSGYRSVEVSGLTVDTDDHMVVGFPIALQNAPPGTEDPVEMVARCNNLVNPNQVADVYVFCGER